MTNIDYLIIFLKNNIKLQEENDKHTSLIYYVLKELDINEKILLNQTAFKEIFNFFQKNSIGPNVYCNYDNQTLTFLNLKDNGHHLKNQIMCIDGKIIIIRNIIDEVDVINQTITYDWNPLTNDIEKVIDYEKFDHAIKTLGGVLYNFKQQKALINEVGFYSEIKTTLITKSKSSNDIFQQETIKRLDDLPLIKVEKNIKNQTKTYYLFDNADFNIEYHNFNDCFDSKEKALENFENLADNIQLTIRRNCENDVDGSIKEYYKIRYDDYKVLNRNYSYKKFS